MEIKIRYPNIVTVMISFVLCKLDELIMILRMYLIPSCTRKPGCQLRLKWFISSSILSLHIVYFRTFFRIHSKRNRYNETTARRNERQQKGG